MHGQQNIKLIDISLRWRWTRKLVLLTCDLFNVLSSFQTTCTYWRWVVVMNFKASRSFCCLALKGVLCTSAWSWKFSLHYSQLDHIWKYTLKLRESNCNVVYCRYNAGQIKASAWDRGETTRCISDKEVPLFVSLVSIPRAQANIQRTAGLASPLIWVWIYSFLSASLLVVMLGRFHVILWKWSTETFICEASELLMYVGNSISKLQTQVATYVFELSVENCHR
jgi:hypothetical protein